MIFALAGLERELKRLVNFLIDYWAIFVVQLDAELLLVVCVRSNPTICVDLQACLVVEIVSHEPDLLHFAVSGPFDLIQDDGLKWEFDLALERDLKLLLFLAQNRLSLATCVVI